jgi:hypothetical protein
VDDCLFLSVCFWPLYWLFFLYLRCWLLLLYLSYFRWIHATCCCLYIYIWLLDQGYQYLRSHWPVLSLDVPRQEINIRCLCYFLYSGNDHLTWRGGGYGFFLKNYSDSQCCWNKYSDLVEEKKIWLRVFVI